MSHIPSLIYCCSRQQFILYYQFINRYSLRDDGYLEIFPQEFGLLEQQLCWILLNLKGEGLSKTNLFSFNPLENLLKVVGKIDESMVLPGNTIKDLLYHRLEHLSTLLAPNSGDSKIIENIVTNLWQITQSIWGTDLQQPSSLRKLGVPSINLHFEDISIPFPKIIWLPHAVSMKLPKSLAVLNSKQVIEKQRTNQKISIALFTDTCLSSDLLRTAAEHGILSLEEWFDYIANLLRVSNVDVVVAQQSIHVPLLKRLHQAQINTVTNISLRYVQPLVHLSGVRPIPSLASFISAFQDRSTSIRLPSSCRGYLKNISVLPMYQDSFIIFEGIRQDGNGGCSVDQAIAQPVISILMSNHNNLWSFKQQQLLIKDSLWFLSQFQKNLQSSRFLLPLSSMLRAGSDFSPLYNSIRPYTTKVLGEYLTPIHFPLFLRFVGIIFELKEYC